MKVTDLDLKKYLQMFTLLDLVEIEKIVEKHMVNIHICTYVNIFYINIYLIKG